MIKNFFNSIFQISTERMKNPFISSFLVALIIINWKAILVMLLSDLKIENRIEYTTGNYINIYDYLILPLAIAVFYTLVLPYIMYGIDRLVKFADDEKLTGYYDREQNKMGRRIELAKSEVELERTRANSEDLSDLNQQIDNLKNHNRHKDDLMQKIQKDFEDVKIELDETRHRYMASNNKIYPEVGADVFLKHLLYNKENRSVFEELGLAYDSGILPITLDNISSKIDRFLNHLNDLEIIEIYGNKNQLNQGSRAKVGFTKYGISIWNEYKKSQIFKDKN